MKVSRATPMRGRVLFQLREVVMSALPVWIVSGALGISMLGAGYFLYHARAMKAPRVAASPDSTEIELDKLKNRVAELEYTMAAGKTERYVVVEARSSPAAHEPGSTRQESTEAPRRPSEEEQRELNARVLHKVDELLRSEQRDRSWASDYEMSLQEAVRATAQGNGAPEVESVTCRTSICRLVLKAASSDKYGPFMSSFHDHLPPMAAVHFAEANGEDGLPRITFDFVRAGYPTAVIEP